MLGAGMYGGGLGGMGMGSMYGGGLGSGMYGGGLGGMGMGSMYGGGLGSGMYGGGMGGGTYGSGGMGSMGGTYGNSNSFMSQNNNGLGSNGFGGGLGGTDPNGQPQLGGQGGSLLPGPTDGPGSPINQVSSTLPPLSETPEERGRRVRAERRKNRQLIHQQREQRRQMQLQAKMEIAGHLTNVLVQTLRSTMELFAVCFGTYYSVKAVRAFANTQQERTQFQRGPNGQMVPVRVAPATAQQGVATAGGAADGGGGGKGRWKTWLLFGIILIVAEVLYSRLSRAFHPKPQPTRRRLRAQQPVEDEFGNVYTQDEEFASTVDSDEEDSLLDSDRGFESDTATTTLAREYAEGPSDVAAPHNRPSSRNRRVFQAIYDYQGTGEEGYLSFKAGDEFIVEDYADGAWCDAIAVDGNRHHAPTGGRGWIPSNFIRPLERTTKL